MGVTIRDVAKEAQTSPATVSRYFSGNAVVGSALSARIEQAAQKLNFIKSKEVKKTSNIVAVMIPGFNLSYYREVINTLIERSAKYPFRLIIIPVTYNNEDYKLYFKDLNIVSVIYLDEDINQDIFDYIRAKNIHIIMFGGAGFDKKCVSVRINDLVAGYEGMDFLLNLGHRDILIFMGKPYKINCDYQRLMGCKEALSKKGLELKDENVIELGTVSYKNAFMQMERVLKQNRKVSAIFAFSDDAAMGVISALNNNGQRVPEDVSVLGFDGIEISSRVYPALSTIYQPIGDMVECTLNDILSYVNNSLKGQDCIDYVLPFTLVNGGTCKKLV